MFYEQVSFSQAVYGYSLAAEARKLSPETLESYYRMFRMFQSHLGDDRDFSAITSKDIESYLGNMSTSKKTVLNHHTGLSALWHWAVDEGLVEKNIVREVKPPKPEKRSIVPYSQSDVKAMLASLNNSLPYTRPGKRASTHKLLLAPRNRAIILILLDTGIRASELSNLKIHQVDLRNRRVKVYGKGSKERTIPFSPRTGKALWRYLATRKDETADAPMFITFTGNPINRNDLRKSIKRVGNRAGVDGVTLHRFRHTFAINYLRNGGDPYSLQMMLGHSTMEMVKTYLAIAQADLERMHKIASPVANWRL